MIPVYRVNAGAFRMPDASRRPPKAIAQVFHSLASFRPAGHRWNQRLYESVSGFGCGDSRRGGNLSARPRYHSERLASSEQRDCFVGLGHHGSGRQRHRHADHADGDPGNRHVLTHARSKWRCRRHFDRHQSDHERRVQRHVLIDVSRRPDVPPTSWPERSVSLFRIRTSC